MHSRLKSRIILFLYRLNLVHSTGNLSSKIKRWNTAETGEMSLEIMVKTKLILMRRLDVCFNAGESPTEWQSRDCTRME